jgi:hypothetical protein
MRKRFDKASMLQASDAPKSANASRRSGLLASSWLVAFGVALVLIALSLSSKEIDSVSALVRHEPISDKDYAQMRIESIVQYKCLSTLYGKESAWNSKAVGNLRGKQQVYGIPQGKSEYLKSANSYKQIDWGLSYIYGKYGVDKDGYINACAALKHWQLKGWH